MKARLITTMSVLLTANWVVATPTVPDNGSGTADLPLHLEHQATGPMYIIDGLPQGTNIAIDALQTAPTSTVEVSGGTLGGTIATGTGSSFIWNLQGSGDLAGYSRTVSIPLTVHEVHAASTSKPPHTVFSFDTTIFALYGQITGDPDFDLLRVTAGDGYGLPSPGETTLTRLANNDWAVDSFFDISYRIDFVGAPGGPLAGRSGSTTGTVRLEAVPEPASLGMLTAGLLLSVYRRRSLFR